MSIPNYKLVPSRRQLINVASVTGLSNQYVVQKGSQGAKVTTECSIITLKGW